MTGAIAPDLFGWNNPAHVGYPNNVPGFKGERGGPSQQAAHIVAPVVNKRRAAALACLKASPVSLTADEVAERLGLSPLACRPRIAELRANGLIEPDAIRGKSSTGMSCHRWKVVSQ